MSDITINNGKVDITPGDAGFYGPQLEKLDALFSRLIKEEKIQCASYLLALKGKIFAWRAMGPLLYNNPEKPLLPTSLRPVASVTKLFTTMSILQLMEKGKLCLEQPVADIIKEFQTDMHRGISLFHLLTHTSGLAPDPGFYLEPYTPSFLELHTVNEVIKAGLEGPVHTQPGERWAYCSIGYVILGEVVKRISGMEYTSYVMKHICEPLGMKDSFFYIPEEKRDRVCLTGERDKKRFEFTGINLFAAGGGLYSTMYDLFRVSQLMLNKGELEGTRILGRKSVEKMITNQLSGVSANAWGNKTSDMKYSLGWSLPARSIVSPGTFSREGAGRTVVYIDPQEELIAIYFVPTTINWVPESIISPLGVIWSGLL